MDSDTIVQRLRESVTQCRALDRAALLEEAAAEIERLRLTEEERLALERLVPQAETYNPRWAQTLRGLLERLSPPAT
jgi:hypothetical protein